MNTGDLKIGHDSDPLHLESCDENSRYTTCLAQQAKYSIDIISRLLDPPILNTTEFIDAIRSRISQRSRIKIRIVVFDPDTIVKTGHRLLDLAGYFSSFIEIRKFSHQHRNYNEFLMIVDQTAYLHRLDWSRYEATLNFNDRRQSVYYQKQFDAIWDASQSDPNLRRIGL